MPARTLESARQAGRGRFEMMDDAYLRERASDVKDIGRRLLGYLQQARQQTARQDQPGKRPVVGGDENETAEQQRHRQRRRAERDPSAALAIGRDEKRKKMIVQYAAKRAELKALGDLDGLAKLPRNSSPTRWKNRCVETGRPRGYMRQFGLSRISFREHAVKGEIPGITKASW